MKIQLLDEAEKKILQLQSLVIYAGIHIRIADYYRLLSKRFPFSIYYKIKNKTIFIYAVLDCRKNPSWIKNRLHKQQ